MFYRNLQTRRTIPTNILEDLGNSLPKLEQTADIVKFCYHIEKSHWLYSDYYFPKDYRLPKLGFKAFAYQMFQHVDFLQIYLPELHKILQDFQS